MEGAHRIGVPAASDGTAAGNGVSHNLVGQRLGRKGRDTRQRILNAAAELLAEPADAPITLSAVARRAGLGMTSLYLYFGDLVELLLAVLEPIRESAEGAYVAHLRERWSDETLHQQCVTFVRSYHAFWRQHARILHLRNSMTDPRMVEHRIGMVRPLIELLACQMDADPSDHNSPAFGMATALFIGLERLIAVHTDAAMQDHIATEGPPLLGTRLLAEGRLLELGIRDARCGIRFAEPAPVFG